MHHSLRELSRYKKFKGTYKVNIMGSSLVRPIGSAVDAKELEYVAALHQTGNELRLDGSIQGKNLQL
jgi:hypothetical protein